MGEKQAVIRQILVITDGCSNVGHSPVDAALAAHRKKTVVNVVGVVDSGDMGKQGKTEAMSIADAGGGLCQIVRPVELSATAQMMTHQTMQLTLQQVVNQELLQIVGKSAGDLPPPERARVMQVVDKLEEEVTLELVVAVDTSASMRDKLPTVQEAIRDLALSLQARVGESRVAVLAFPGRGDEWTKVIQPFMPDVQMDRLAEMFVARGGTPTGPAIDAALRMLEQSRQLGELDDFPNRRWTGESVNQ